MKYNVCLSHSLFHTLPPYFYPFSLFARLHLPVGYHGYSSSIPLANRTPDDSEGIIMFLMILLLIMYMYVCVLFSVWFIYSESVLDYEAAVGSSLSDW